MRNHLIKTLIFFKITTMKILVVCQYYYPENFIVTKVAEQFALDGHEVHVLTGKPNYGYGYILPAYKNISEEVVNGVNIHRVKLYPRKKSRLSIIRNYLSFWRNSKKWVRKTKIEFDYVYSMSLSPVTICCAGNLYAKKHHVKHIIHCLDLGPESTLVTHAVRKNSLVYHRLYKWSRSIYSKADKILISSPSFADYFKNVLKLPTNNIRYVPQCSLVEDSDIAAFDYGKGTHVLYCGNLGIIQQIPLLVEAMTLLKDEDIYFHIIGMGPMSDYLINSIKERGLENKLIYHGPIVAKLASAYFKRADALLVSLKADGTVGKTIPSKLMMYLAFGRPIVGVIQGDGKDVLEDSGGAFLANEDPESVKNALLAISNLSEKEKARLGKLNRQYYESHFSLRTVASQIEIEFK